MNMKVYDICTLSHLLFGSSIIVLFNDFNGKELALIFSGKYNFVVFFFVGKDLVSDVDIGISICNLDLGY